MRPQRFEVYDKNRKRIHLRIGYENVSVNLSHLCTFFVGGTRLDREGIYEDILNEGQFKQLQEKQYSKKSKA